MSANSICCCWSGGKDSCLALWRTMRAGVRPVCLVTMFTEDGERSRSHGLARDVLEAQAAAIGAPLLSRSASWDDYEAAMVDLLLEAKAFGATGCVFGDIDIPRHRAWEENVCSQAGLVALLPLWQQDRLAILDEWWAAGFEARIIVAREGVVDRRFLGRVLDRQTADELIALGVDACGENGEFHTVVTAGPIFRQPLSLWTGEQVLRSGCWFQDLSITQHKRGRESLAECTDPTRRGGAATKAGGTADIANIADGQREDEYLVSALIRDISEIRGLSSENLRGSRRISSS